MLCFRRHSVLQVNSCWQSGPSSSILLLSCHILFTGSLRSNATEIVRQKDILSNYFVLGPDLCTAEDQEVTPRSCLQAPAFREGENKAGDCSVSQSFYLMVDIESGSNYKGKLRYIQKAASGQRRSAQGFKLPGPHQITPWMRVPVFSTCPVPFGKVCW